MCSVRFVLAHKHQKGVILKIWVDRRKSVVVYYPWLPPTSVTVEKAKECLAELSVHETVRDGITATGNVGEKLHQANACAPDHGINQFRGEKMPRIDHVQWCPADEKFQHDYEQHSDHLKSRCTEKFSQSTVTAIPQETFL